jgi:hypothetical protein
MRRLSRRRACSISDKLSIKAPAPTPTVSLDEIDYNGIDPTAGLGRQQEDDEV